MKSYYVYVLRDPRHDNQPFYVGKGKGQRCTAHLNEKLETTENIHKWNKIQAIRNSGLEVTVEKIWEDLTEEDAFDLEAELIKAWGRKGYDPDGILTNICIDQRPPSPLGRPVSEETKRKIGDAQRGDLNHRYGVSWSSEDKERRSQWALENGIRPPDHTGMKRSDETKQKIGDALRGKAKSAEHRKALSDAVSGENHRNWGKNLDEDLKARIRASNINADSPIKKANWDDVREIRLMHRLGTKAKAIQERFEYLSVATIYDIIREKTWKEEFRPRP